jgi:hypothetical protein
MIRKVYDMGWKPLFCLSNVSISVGAVMEPAGPEKGVGIASTLYLKDSSDPAWNDDAGMNEWRQFMKEYLPGADLGLLTFGGFPCVRCRDSSSALAERRAWWIGIGLSSVMEFGRRLNH